MDWRTQIERYISCGYFIYFNIKNSNTLLIFNIKSKKHYKDNTMICYIIYYERSPILNLQGCKYDSKNDFVIDLDNVWKWLDFSQKDAVKRVIDKNFYINRDYKIFAPQVGGAKKDTRGSHKGLCYSCSGICQGFSIFI